MCGICGVLGLGVDQGRDAVERMLPWIRHRGPDGEGCFIDEGVALCHSRLAIRGIEGGRQPVVEPPLALVFNGELYGDAVDASLRESGCSDTNFVFSQMKEWGRHAFKKLEGMFALAFWDGARRQCLLARDRVGEKPLFVAPQPGGVLYFASEMRALVAGLSYLPSIDPLGVQRYLSLGYAPSPQTVLEGIRQIEPGSFLLWQEGEARRPHIYWNIFDHCEEKAEASASEALVDVLRRSVRGRLGADVPLGILVSGGVDSAAVAGIARRASGQGFPCFSLGFEEQGYDELPWAEKVVSALDLPHRTRRLVPSEIPELAERAFAAMDGPMGDPSWIPTFALAELASEEVKVALGGDGADELFGGYQAFSFERWAAFVDDHSWIPAHAIGNLISKFSPARGYRTPRYAIKQFLQGLGMSSRRRHLLWMGAWRPAEAGRMLESDGDDEEFWSFLPEDRPGVDPGNFLLAHYFRYYLGECLLVKSDRASMAHGLEIRSPFLDSQMVALAMRTPFGMKHRGMQGKICLKEALGGVVDQSVLDRSKQGFAPPLSDWIRGPLRDDLLEALRCLDVSWGMVPSTEVEPIVTEHLGFRRDHRRRLWVLYALAKGMENLKRAAG